MLFVITRYFYCVSVRVGYIKIPIRHMDIDIHKLRNLTDVRFFQSFIFVFQIISYEIKNDCIILRCTFILIEIVNIGLIKFFAGCRINYSGIKSLVI